MTASGTGTPARGSRSTSRQSGGSESTAIAEPLGITHMRQMRASWDRPVRSSFALAPERGAGPHSTGPQFRGCPHPPRSDSEQLPTLKLLLQRAGRRYPRTAITYTPRCNGDWLVRRNAAGLVVGR